MNSKSFIPYELIATDFKAGEVVPFLGAGASYAGAEKEKALPGGHEFAERLSNLIGYPGNVKDPLTKVTQYFSEKPGNRDDILTQIRGTFHEKIVADYQCSFTSFLLDIPQAFMPKLIITTNYDTLIEQTLEKRNIKYLVVSHILGEGIEGVQHLCYSSLKTVPDKSNLYLKSKLEEKLHAEFVGDVVLVYKMHGTAFYTKEKEDYKIYDSIVITENDYIQFMSRPVESFIPTIILNAFLTKKMLFLGYSLEDWNFRVLLAYLRNLNPKKAPQRHWAFLPAIDKVDEIFWDRRNVNVYHPSNITSVLPELLKQIRKTP